MIGMRLNLPSTQDFIRVHDGSRSVLAPVGNGHFEGGNIEYTVDYWDEFHRRSKAVLHHQHSATKTDDHIHPSRRATHFDTAIYNTDLQKDFSTSRFDRAGSVVSSKDGHLESRGRGRGGRKRSDKKDRFGQKMEREAKDDVFSHPATMHSDTHDERTTSRSSYMDKDSVLARTKGWALFGHTKLRNDTVCRENSQQAMTRAQTDRMVPISPAKKKRELETRSPIRNSELLNERHQPCKETGPSEEDGHQWRKKESKDKNRGGARGRGSKRGGSGKG